MDLFFEIHKDLPREGPGDDESTARAFALCRELPDAPRVLDIGCGPGMQTRQLARISKARIAAIDMHLPFLRVLQRRARQEIFSGQVIPLRMSMFDLGFAPESFDLVWSEGAIYIRGFEEGLRACLPLLKPGGYAAVSELTWLRPDPPEEIRAFWCEGYPGMRALEENRQTVRALGYQEIDTFVLPDSSWLEAYYGPMAQRIARLREEWQAYPERLALLDAEEKEIILFQKFSAWYGYVFYILRKP